MLVAHVDGRQGRCCCVVSQGARAVAFWLNSGRTQRRTQMSIWWRARSGGAPMCLRRCAHAAWRHPAHPPASLHVLPIVVRVDGLPGHHKLCSDFLTHSRQRRSSRHEPSRAVPPTRDMSTCTHVGVGIRWFAHLVERACMRVLVRACARKTANTTAQIIRRASQDHHSWRGLRCTPLTAGRWPRSQPPSTSCRRGTPPPPSRARRPCPPRPAQQ